MKLYNICVSEACNLKCKYCYEGVEKHNRMFNCSNIPKLIEFIKQTKENFANTIVFHGGEPLLGIHIIEKIIIDLDKHGIIANYNLTTNGTLLTTKNLEIIKNNNIFLSLSIDGDKDTNDLNRVDEFGIGTYDKINGYIDIINNLGIQNRIRMTVIPETVSKLEYNIKHLISLGAKNIVAAPDLFNKNWNDAYITILRDELIKIRTLKNTLTEDTKVNFYKNKHICTSCGGGINDFYIGYDGNIYPCSVVVNKVEYCIGDIFKGVDINKVNKLKEIYLQRNDQCKGCKNEFYCMGTKCKIVNKVITGHYDKPSELICEIENLLIKNNIISS